VDTVAFLAALKQPFSVHHSFILGLILDCVGFAAWLYAGLCHSPVLLEALAF